MKKDKEAPSGGGFFNFLKYFQLKNNEMIVYNTLSRKPMTIKQLQSSTKMSERSLRMHLDDLVKRNFVKRKIVEGKHLKYIYYANSGENILDIMKKKIEEIEKKRIKTKEEIIKGYEDNMKK